MNAVVTWASLATDARKVKVKITSRDRLLRSTPPAASVASTYADRLLRMIGEMERSVLWWVSARYRADPPKMALDDLASSAMARAIRELRRRWLAGFDAMAERLARYFAGSARRRNDERLKKILRDGGFSVDWRMTPAMRDVVGAIVHENVALIRSIPREQLDRVEGAVMRSVQTGRDLGQLYRELTQTFGVAKKRARLIARDQNNKATGLLQGVRFAESGITECIWMHSHAGKTPRPSHVKAGRDRVRFDPAKGWFDPHEKKYIWPGYLIGCRCTCKPVVRGFRAS